MRCIQKLPWQVAIHMNNNDDDFIIYLVRCLNGRGRRVILAGFRKEEKTNEYSRKKENLLQRKGPFKSSEFLNIKTSSYLPEKLALFHFIIGKTSHEDKIP